MRAVPIYVSLLTLLLAGGAMAQTKPIYLYTPAPAAGAFTASAPASPAPSKDCGTLQNPCQGLDDSDTTAVLPSFGSSFTYGVRGAVETGVSNHGYGSAAGVQFYAKKDNLTVALDLWYGYNQWNGKHWP
jgi:hypothetical protein